MANVYLETSFFSACVSTRTSDKSKGWRASSLEWWETRSPRHDLFVSDEVIRELSAPTFKGRGSALAMLRGLRALEISGEASQLAQLLVQHKLMPEPAVAGDALHVAVAIVHGMDYVLTWNIKHLANPNKRSHLGLLCLKLGYELPQIVTPDLLQE